MVVEAELLQRARRLSRVEASYRKTVKGDGLAEVDVHRFKVRWSSSEGLGQRGTGHVCRRHALAEGIGLGAVQLAPALDLCHAHLAGRLVFLGLHLNVVLGEAEGAVVLEEGAVAAVEDVDVGVGEPRVVFFVDLTIAAPDVLSPMRVVSVGRRIKGPEHHLHEWSTVGRIFAVKNQGLFA